MLPFSREKIAPVLKQIGSNDPDLTSVNLCHKRITNKQVLQIADALGGNTHVTEIWLTNNEISDESSDGIAKTTSAGAVGYLMSALEGNRTVLEVYLGGNKIGTKGVASVCNMLRVNSVITDLGLEDNEICDDGARMLLDAVGQNTTLQTLKMTGNVVGNDSPHIKSINELLKRNREVAKLLFEAEHPELVTHKLRRPEKEKEKERKRTSRSSRSRGGEGRKDGDRRRRRDGEQRRSDSKREGRPSSSNGQRKSPSGSPRIDPSAEAFLEERKRTVGDSSGGNKSLMNKLKGLSVGGRKSSVDCVMKGATFV